jgi:hypothetical protein
LDIWELLRANGVTVGCQPELLAEVKSSIAATVASGERVREATFTGNNVPVSDTYIFLLFIIELAGLKVSLLLQKNVELY